MSNQTLSKFQIGKNGLTDGVLQSLSQDLKHHKQIRVSVLKSACRDRQGLQEIAIKLKESLPVKNYRIIGYTIILIK